MTKELACLVIHGIGRQEPDFANDLIAGVSRQLQTFGRDPEAVAWQSVYWDDILRPAQNAYLQAASAKADLNALGDAASYRQLPSGRSRGGEETLTYRRIHERVKDLLGTLYHGSLQDRPVPLVALAHSFGGHIFSNYIWDRQQRPDKRLSSFEWMNWLSGFITFGCNIPLFTFTCTEVVPIRFPPPRLPARLKPNARWLNFFDPDDVLAWPLRPINGAYAGVVDSDERIHVGGPVTGRTPASHLAYWSDKRFAKRIIKFLDSLL